MPASSAFDRSMCTVVTLLQACIRQDECITMTFPSGCTKHVRKSMTSSQLDAPSAPRCRKTRLKDLLRV
eukprot:9424217-Lingulodinium_polyedra.AAC.1